MSFSESLKRLLYRRVRLIAGLLFTLLYTSLSHLSVGICQKSLYFRDNAAESRRQSRDIKLRTTGKCRQMPKHENGLRSYGTGQAVCTEECEGYPISVVRYQQLKFFPVDPLLFIHASCKLPVWMAVWIVVSDISDLLLMCSFILNMA